MQFNLNILSDVQYNNHQMNKNKMVDPGTKIVL